MGAAIGGARNRIGVLQHRGDLGLVAAHALGDEEAGIRIRVASVSPKLLDIYGEDGMRLELLMAFTVSDDEERQVQVLDMIADAHPPSPTWVRQKLTENSVRVSNKRPLRRARCLCRGPAAVLGNAPAEPEIEEEPGLKPLSERLVSDLTAWRTLALQDSFAQSSDTVYVAVLHSFVLSCFYGYKRFGRGNGNAALGRLVQQSPTLRPYRAHPAR